MTRRPRRAPLVPTDAPSARTLVAVVAILSFLAALAALGAIATMERAAEWRAATAREATIQVIPTKDRDPDADLARAASLAKASPGIAEVRIMSRQAAEGLLEPWLGRGLDLGQLPVPRLAILILADGANPKLDALARTLAAEVPTATLDDHARWLARLTAAADTVAALAGAIVLLVLAATGLASAVVTRGAVASAHDVVEVLSLIGAEDRFVAGLFARRFLVLSLRGATIGVLAAAIAALLARSLLPRADDAAHGLADLLLPGPGAIGWTDLATLVAVPIASAGLAAWVSRTTVKRFLREDRRA